MADTAHALALSFHSTQFDIVDRNGQPWLRSGEIAQALGYADASSVNRIYARRADEFTDEMTGSVKLTDPNGDQQETRIFSLRGAHLLAMFARTAIAKEFRRWVLDVLDREVSQPRLTGLTKQQASTVRVMIEAAQKQFTKALAKVEAQIVEWELVDAPPKNDHYLRARVQKLGRHPDGDWGMFVISGECGFAVKVGKDTMAAGGVRVGDTIRLEYDKGVNPLCGPFRRVVKV